MLRDSALLETKKLNNFIC